MLTTILELLTGAGSTLWPYLAGAVALLAGVLGFGASQRRRGRQDATLRAMKDALNRQEDGRDAVSNLRGADRDERVDSLRDNDAEW